MQEVQKAPYSTIFTVCARLTINLVTVKTAKIKKELNRFKGNLPFK